MEIWFRVTSLAQIKFHRNHRKKYLRGKIFWWYLLELNMYLLSLVCERCLFLLYKMIDLWRNYRDPPKTVPWSFQRNYWFSPSVLKISNTLQQISFITWSRFSSLCILMTLTRILGHKGQKGQILKSAANGLKRVEN